jgi:hypothetical protein
MLADKENSIDSLKQIALTRRFDLKQAIEVVRTVAEASPFDKVDCLRACYLVGVHACVLACLLVRCTRAPCKAVLNLPLPLAPSPAGLCAPVLRVHGARWRQRWCCVKHC